MEIVYHTRHYKATVFVEYCLHAWLYIDALQLNHFPVEYSSIDHALVLDPFIWGLFF